MLAEAGNIKESPSRLSSEERVPKLDKSKLDYSEQDTADKLALPYLSSTHGFPAASSLDYQAQHTVALSSGTGRYDGLYLSGGYPYVVLEVKKYAHDLADDDIAQARDYATSDSFDKPVPFIVVSNGREHRFLKVTTTISPEDGKLEYAPIPAVSWTNIRTEPPGEVRRLLDAKELLTILKAFKAETFQNIHADFWQTSKKKYDLSRNPSLGPYLEKIISSRQAYVGTVSGGFNVQVRFAIEAISLHFTIKILFIKLIEDLSSGSDTPRIIHNLFPRKQYRLIGGLFGHKVLNSLGDQDVRSALRLYLRSNRFYKAMAKDLAEVEWADIFRFGFNFHKAQFGHIFRADNYDRFLPSEDTLKQIHDNIIKLDIRSAIIYQTSASSRENILGDIYGKLIDDELRNSIGAVYTPDKTVEFMMRLGKEFCGGFRGNKIVEPACGSGHFYRAIYREYVNEVVADQGNAGQAVNFKTAHEEALRHAFGRDIDPFAVQLTLLGIFLEQLRDNVEPSELQQHGKRWLANASVDTQNSLDPITVHPDHYFDIEKTDDLHGAISRRTSCIRASNPALIIGNPPYGVSVVMGRHYTDIYKLSSKDSYGYFIANAIARLPEGKRVLFIVSSSFLTIKSHLDLRKLIVDETKIIRIIKLHRATFPGIDIFPAILELERCSDLQERADNVYQFFDFWQLHPVTDEAELVSLYDKILGDLSASKKWLGSGTRTARYTVRQGILSTFSRVPIFEGWPSLFKFMQDVFPSILPTKKLPRFDGNAKKEVRVAKIKGKEFVKLREIADVRVGLQSGDNKRFYRVAKGAKGGAVKGGYEEVSPKNVMSDADLSALSDAEKADGVVINDPTNDKYFVPLDKAGLADIEGGLLRIFYQPVEFYVDWSRNSVKVMQGLKSARFQNQQYYFKKGVSYSMTGIYSPTFRLSHGAVMDQKSPCIFSDTISPEFLLGVLSSTLTKYFVKAFINHGVDSQVEDVPIVLPSKVEGKAIEDKVSEIVKELKAVPNYDYRPKLAELDELVFDLFGLTSAERKEVQTWYVRRYPALH